MLALYIRVSPNNDTIENSGSNPVYYIFTVFICPAFPLSAGNGRTYSDNSLRDIDLFGLGISYDASLKPPRKSEDMLALADCCTRYQKQKE